MVPFTLLLSFLIFSATISTFGAQEKQCDYLITVNTGPTKGPSTSKLRTFLSTVTDNINTTNLIKNWGAMGKGHTYFLPNSSDVFKYRGRCLQYSFCNLSIDGKKGELNPHWFINLITVLTTGEEIPAPAREFARLEEVVTLYPGIDSGECGDPR